MNDKTTKTSDSSPSVARSAGRMGLATLFSRILGLVREQVFAFLFGASHAADAFNIAFRIPNLLRDLFAEGAMSAAFVPQFTKTLIRSRVESFSLLAAVLTLLVIGLSLLALIGILLSPQLVALYASSFHTVPGKFELTVQLTQIMFPFFPLVAAAAVVMGALNALGFFFLPAFAPVLFNFISILSGLTLCPLFAYKGWFPSIFGMAIGVVLGGFFQFYVQWFQIRKQGFQFKSVSQALVRPWEVEGVKKILWLLVPGTIGLAATQLNILVNSIYATSYGAGAVSWLNYAFRLMQFPIGIFGVSLAAATLPMVSRRLAEGDPKASAQELSYSLKLSFAINLPAAAGLMAIGLPLIQLLFQHGQFQIFDSQQTASALFWYALGLPGYSAVKIIVPIYYALGSTRFPVGVSFVAVGLNAALNHIFLNILQYPFWALALATSIVATLNAVALGVGIARRLPGIINLKFFQSFFTHCVVAAIIFATSIAGIHAISMLRPHLEWLRTAEFLYWTLQIGVAICIAAGVWIAIGVLFRVEEIQKTIQFLEKKLCRNR